MITVWIGDIKISDREGPIGVTRSGIDGWWDLPDLKSEVEQRVGEHGGFPFGRPLYSSRMVQFNVVSVAGSTDAHRELWKQVNALHGTTQVVRVIDDDDTYIVGAIETDYPAERLRRGALFTVTVTAPDPFRYATDPRNLFLQSQSVGTSGLNWTDEGLLWPLDWGQSGLEGNTGIIRNDGNATAYPVITIHGDHPSGVTISDDLGRSIVYDGPILASSPVTLDCGRRYASSNGVNRSQFLAIREWFDVEPGGDRTLSFLPHEQSDGWAEVEIRDTYL